MSVHNAQRAKRVLFLVLAVSSAESYSSPGRQAGIGSVRSPFLPADFPFKTGSAPPLHSLHVILDSLRDGFLNNPTGGLNVSQARRAVGLKHSASLGTARHLVG